MQCGHTIAWKVAMTARITPQQKRQIERLHADGSTLSAIAEKLGIDRHTVARHVEAAENDRAQPAMAGFSEVEVAWLRALATNGRSLRCEACGHVIIALKAMNQGFCPSCGTGWQLHATRAA